MERYPRYSASDTEQVQIVFLESKEDWDKFHREHYPVVTADSTEVIYRKYGGS